MDPPPALAPQEEDSSSSGEASTPEEELGEIVELPALDTSFEIPDPNSEELVFFDPVDHGWPYGHPWYHGIYDEHDCGGCSVGDMNNTSMMISMLHESETMVPCFGLECSLWQH